MNKKYVKAILVAVVALISGINVFNVQKSESLSDMALANVEALAQNEIQPTNCPGGRHLCAWIIDPIYGPVTYYDRNGDDTI